jgi:hypothetical protein
VRLGIFMAVNIPVMVFWVMTPCSDVVGCQHFGGPCHLHLQAEMWPPVTYCRCHLLEKIEVGGLTK